MNIEQVLDYYRPEVGFLLRKYRVIGDVNMDTIKKAHGQYGERFMMDLLEIITPDDASFTNLFTLENPFVQNLIATQQQQVTKQDVASAQSGKFWSFWDNLLNGINKTGETIKDFKSDINQPPESQAYQTAAVPVVNADRNKTILIIAGVLVVSIVAILIFKK